MRHPYWYHSNVISKQNCALCSAEERSLQQNNKEENKMGSYISWKLDADTDIHGEKQILEIANSHQEFSKDPIQGYMWRKWSRETKWWAVEFATWLSKQVDVVFKLEARGDHNFTWFIYKGNILSEEEVFSNPRFPSRPLFKKKIGTALAERERRKQAQEQERLKKEKETIQRKLEELEKEQAELKKRLTK